MSTPPGPPPGSDPYGWPPPNTPPGGSPGPGQPYQAPDTPGGGYPQSSGYPAPGGGYPEPPTVASPGGYGAPPPPSYPDPSGGYGAPAPYGQPAYAGMPGQYSDPSAPFGYDPQGRPYSDKQKLVAGLLQILLGGFGVGRFYTGHTGIAIAQIAVTLVTCGIGAIWGLIDGIMILVNGGTDSKGRPLRAD
jgi:TM2 domain-containing membrane protein YozV